MARILLVEDDVAAWEPLKILLEMEDHIVDIAESVIQVEQVADQAKEKKQPYNFVITDMELRNKAGSKGADKEGGIEVVKIVLKHKVDFAKILIISGRTAIEDKRRDELKKLGIGEEQILIKPVSPDTIIERIKKS